MTEKGEVNIIVAMGKDAKKIKEFDQKREFSVILEKVYNEIRVISEDITSVKNKVEAIFEEQGRQKEDIFIIKADIRIIKGDIQTLKDDVKTTKEDIAEIKPILKGQTEKIAHLEAFK